MHTYIAYFDEMGDDGANVKSSNQFVITSDYMDSNVWQQNYYQLCEARKKLKEKRCIELKSE